MQHTLPDGVDPYGNVVELRLVSGDFEVSRAVAYGEFDGGFTASTVFDYPDAGCLITVQATILNSSLSLIGQPDRCL